MTIRLINWYSYKPYICVAILKEIGLIRTAVYFRLLSFLFHNSLHRYVLIQASLLEHLDLRKDPINIFLLTVDTVYLPFIFL